MRHGLIAVLMLALLGPQAVLAQSSEASRIWLTSPSLQVGQRETVNIVALDLSGNPLARASVTVNVQYPHRHVLLHLPPTDLDGATFASFAPPSSVGSGRVVVAATISNGYLKIPLQTSFVFNSKSSFSASTPLVLLARVVPSVVEAPNPAWLVVYAKSRTGAALAGALVTARVKMGQVWITVSGRTDKDGVATLKMDTRSATRSGDVHVTTQLTWQGHHASAAGKFTVAQAPLSATASPTPVATPLPPTPTATMIPVPIPAPAPTAVPTVGSTPTATPIPTPTTTDTAPAATNTPVMFASTPVPTFTPVGPPPVEATTLTPTPVPTATPAWTPGPTATPAVPPPCPGTYSGHDGCMDAMLGIINQTRLQYNLGPLQLNLTQSLGNGSCVGSIGHSQAMADSGTIWHENPSYPQASFPSDLCFGLSGAENVGYSATGNELQDLQTMESIMMQEPHDPFPQACRGVISHACNILTTQHSQVGIGIVQSGGRTYVTEDFVN